MSAVPVSPVLPSLLDTGSTADAGSLSIPRRNPVGHHETRKSQNKLGVQAPDIRWRLLGRTLAVSLFFLVPSLFGSCVAGASAPPPQLESSTSSPVPSPSALLLTPTGDDAAEGSSPSTPLSAEQAENHQPGAHADPDNGKAVDGSEQDSAQARLQRAVGSDNGKLRAPPLLHIHRAFSFLTADVTSAISDTKPMNDAPTRSHLDSEPEAKRIGAQARSKPTATAKGAGQEASVLPLRTYAYGNIHQTAYYFADVVIGTPPVQRQSLILDTGSSVVGFPCTTCKSCGAHIDPPFDCMASATCKRLQCSTSCTHCDSKQRRCAYRVSYMEGSSLQGFWHEDYIHVLKPPRIIMKNNERVYDIKTQITQARKSLQSRPSNKLMLSPLLSPPTVTNFGCHMEETALFVNQKASGIWGLEIWSQFGPPTYMTRVLLGSVPDSPQSRSSSSTTRSAPSPPSTSPPPIRAAPVFALCLAEHGGAFAIGESHKELHTSKLVKTRFIPDQESYSVYISAIVVGEQNIALYPPKAPAASAKLPPAFVSAPFETLRPLTTSSSRSAGADVHFEVLLDSGTTMSYFPTEVYTKIVTAIERYADQQNEKLYPKARRLGASVDETQRGKAFAADGRKNGRLLPLYGVDDELDIGDVIKGRNAAEYLTTDAEERRLSALRGETETLHKTMIDDGEDGESDDVTEIVRNPTATKLVQHSGVEKAGVRRTVPGEAQNSVTQRHPKKTFASPEPPPEGPKEFPAIREVSLIEKNRHASLDRLQDTKGNQHTQGQKHETAASTQKPHISALVHGDSLGIKGISTKSADTEESPFSSIVLVGGGRAPRHRGQKTLRVACGRRASCGAGRTERRSGKETLVTLGRNIHTVFPGRRPRLSGILEKLQRRRKARLVAFGEEVRDSEAEIIGDILSSHHVDDEEAYTFLPQSASPRQSQAVKVESAEGELCFYLPMGRPDLKYFPDIWIRFVQTSPRQQTSNSATRNRNEDAEAQDAATARTWAVNAGERESVMREASGGWLRWAPASYLYTKGNDHYRCIAVSDDPNSATTGVLGSSFFIGHDVIFDVGNHTVAFAEADCPRIRLKDRPTELPL